jgi:hypothetical protein
LSEPNIRHRYLLSKEIVTRVYPRDSIGHKGLSSLRFCYGYDCGRLPRHFIDNFNFVIKGFSCSRYKSSLSISEGFFILGRQAVSHLCSDQHCPFLITRRFVLPRSKFSVGFPTNLDNELRKLHQVIRCRPEVYDANTQCVLFFHKSIRWIRFATRLKP